MQPAQPRQIGITLGRCDLLVLTLLLAMAAGAANVGAESAQNQVLPAQKAELTQQLFLGAVSLAGTLAFDEELSHILQTPLPAGLDWTPQALSGLASEAGIAALHTLMYARDKELAVRSAKATATALAATYLLKFMFGRERPDAPGGNGAFHGPSLSDDRHSMPSGHATAAFAMARVLADDDPEHAAVYYTLATLVGLSRINLSRHWPSDVLAGAFIGFHAGGIFR